MAQVGVGRARRAIVPLDGSAVAEAVLPVVAEIADPLGLEIVLLRVVELLSPGESEATHALVDTEEQARLARARQYLASLTLQFAGRMTSVQSRVRCGHPASEIVAEAREQGADLIVMTTHGRTGLARLLAGSVASSVMRRAQIPVLVRRPGPVTTPEVCEDAQA